MLPSIVLFGKEISYYQIFILIGIFAAGIFALKLSEKKNYKSYDILVFLLFTSIGVVIGGHILYGITNIEFLGYFALVRSLSQFFRLTLFIFGGSVFYGGLIGGMIAAKIYSKAKKMPIQQFMGFTDIAAPAIALFHVFGRLGCFISGCCYGIPSQLGFTYHHSMAEAANEVNRFPVQLIEAAVNLIIFFILYYFLRHKKHENKLIFIYLIAYSFARFFLEFFRGDEYRGFLLGLSTSQIISIFLLAFAVVNILLMKIKGKSA